jgi:LemA protein
MGTGLIVTLVIVALVVIFLLWGVAIYNGLVRMRALVKEGFSGITVQLRRRADLIPNLVSTVEGYATHERETLNEVIAHRGDAVSAKGVAATAQADTAMSAMIGRLMVVAEAYPDLKANANFQQLQTELTEIEDELQNARRYYNATVRDLNTSIQSFPNVLIARPMGFHEEEFYTDTDSSIQVAPKVQFGAAKA